LLIVLLIAIVCIFLDFSLERCLFVVAGAFHQKRGSGVNAGSCIVVRRAKVNSLGIILSRVCRSMTTSVSLMAGQTPLPCLVPKRGSVGVPA
jgi:hypothetical protein